MYAAAGGLSLARRQARRQQQRQQAAESRPPLRAPATPLPPIRHQFHPKPPQDDELLQMSRNVQAQLLDPAAHNYPELNGLSPEAALYVRDKQRQRRKKAKRGRVELPSNVATKDIAPFPRFPPNTWGKAAWQERERERRVSLTEVAVNHRIKATEAHRRWMKRNRIHDSSFGGSSSDDEDIPGGLYGHQSAAANALLYVGLGTVAIGLVISFVGTGEKGFKTLELRLIGPTLIGSGLLCCLVRIFLCVCPSRCFRRRHKPHHHHHHHHHHHKQPQQSFFEPPPQQNKDSKPSEDIALADQTSLLQKNTNKQKTVSIVTTPATTSQPPPPPPPSQKNVTPPPSASDNVVASTTLFLQHERDTNLLDLELQQLDASSFDISSFDSGRERDGIVSAKSDKRRTSLTSVHKNGCSNPDPEAHRLEEELLLLEDELRPPASSSPDIDRLLQNEIVLSPSKLQQ